eukprot:5091110-Heterocapsa_arctica.AAC.1
MPLSGWWMVSVGRMDAILTGRDRLQFFAGLAVHVESRGSVKDATVQVAPKESLYLMVVAACQ